MKCSAIIHTYSIVARDPETGELGVAVQSHYFAVGSVVPWVEANVGAVATQAMGEPGYGRRGLDLMRAGKSAPEALAQLLADDVARETRQVAMIDSAGRVGVHTGAATVESAGHIAGDNFSVQGNMLLNGNVWPAMADAFAQTAGDLAARMLAALDAAEAAGGDIRGRQSAALVVASGKPGAPSWEKSFDLRVDDSPEPLIELRRLLGMGREMVRRGAAGAAASRGDFAAAAAELAAAGPDAPETVENMYWRAILMAVMGRVDESIPLFRQVFAHNRNWATLTRRLPKSGLFPVDPRLLDRILADSEAK